MKLTLLSRAWLRRYALEYLAEDAVSGAVEKMLRPGDEGAPAHYAMIEPQDGRSAATRAYYLLSQVVQTQIKDLLRHHYGVAEPAHESLWHIASPLKPIKQTEALEADVAAALDTLDPVVRQLAEMVLIDGDTLIDAAKLLEISQRTAERWIADARAQLSHCLSQYCLTAPTHYRGETAETPPSLTPSPVEVA